MDKLRSISAFIVAVESGNFSEAAKKLDITAVMVGKYVSQLESELNICLIERNTRRQHLTEAGKSYFDECKQLLAHLGRAEANLESMKRYPSGTLRISAPLNLGASVIAGVIARYQQHYQDVRIELELSDNFVDLIGQGFDFALRIGELTGDETLVAQRLGEYKMTICASPDYLTRHGTPEKPEDLAQHRCLSNMQWNKRNAWQLSDTVFWPSVGTFSSNDGLALRHAALAGVGLLLQPRILVADDIAAGKLVPVLNSWQHSSRPVHLLWRQDLHPSEKRSSFIQWLRNEIPPALNA
ncbi:LysR family transcriptional regulator [Pantoea sp. BAV 3049]|uniref:LysR family transcriptional regulator n=1 Tax=Pantoea sp. BAV 3049 TaxID=2654188 RepID=UPI00131E5B44|nr:LysR family transcriptional regulator [Pantoea sp. BAV 3049]